MRIEEIQEGLLRDVPSETVARFLQYMRDHKEIWFEFERLALLSAKKRGKFSAKAIMERVRWEFLIERGEDDFLINNTWTAYFARVFEMEHKGLCGFFEKRKIRGVKC